MNEPELDGLKPCPFCGRRRRYTVEHDMSRKQLAKMCGTSPVTFSRCLNGHFKLPPRVLFNMANAMKMDVNELVVKADE